MWNDPVIEEIHKIRAEHAARFRYDLAAIVEDVRKEEQQSGKRFISLPPRLVVADVDAGLKAARKRQGASGTPLVLRDSGENE